MFGFLKKTRQPKAQPQLSGPAAMWSDLLTWEEDFLTRWNAHCEAARTPYERERSRLQQQRVLLDSQISVVRAQQELEGLLRQSTLAAPANGWSIREIPRRGR